MIGSIVSGGIGMIGGLVKTVQGANQKRQYADMIANYDRQELTNQAENIQLSTHGSDIMREDAGRNMAMIMRDLRNGGSRNLIGAIGKVAGIGVDASQRASLDLDSQHQRRQYAIAQDGQRIRGMQEQRENQDLAGMGAMALAGGQDQMNGMSDISTSMMSMGRGVDDYLKDKK